MELIPAGQGAKLELDLNHSIELGRKPEFGITSTKISRRHCKLSCRLSSAGQLEVEILAYKRLFLNQRATGGALQAGETCTLQPGDQFFLLQLGERFEYGYSVALQARRAPLNSLEKGAEQQSTYKRARLVQNPISSPPAARPSTTAGIHTPGQDSREPSTDKQPKASPPDTSAAIFSGCYLVFWYKSHASRLLARAKQLGAVEQECPDAATTHVIARYDITRAEVSDRLRCCEVRWGLPQSGDSPSGNAPPLPEGIHFVTPDWVSESIARGRRVGEASYHISLHNFQPPPDNVAAGPADGPRSEEGGDEGGSPRTPRGGGPSLTMTTSLTLGSTSMGAPSLGDSSLPSLPADSALLVSPSATGGSLASPSAMGGSLASPSATAGSVASMSAAGGPLASPSAAGGSAAPRSAAPVAGTGGAWFRSGLRVPPPEEVCSSAERWGEGGRWVEPWQEANARDSLEQLLSHWYRRDVRLSPGQRSKPGRTDDGDGSGGSGGSGDERRGACRELQQQQQQLQLNGVCEHVCCCYQPFCIIAEMQRARGAYLGARNDEFRVKALERGLAVLRSLPHGLRTVQDVQPLGLGSRTAAKLCEILSTGTLRRSNLLQDDTRCHVIATFMQVWGAADATCDRWYAAGCRSIADVAARHDLTEQQRIGVKYYEDFLRRVPRPEVEQCQSIVREEAARVVEEATGLSADAVRHRLHVRAVGSFLRGRPDCGDIDFIIAPPPAADPERLRPAELLSRLLTRLLAAGHVTRDLPLSQHKLAREGDVTYMGVWKGPDSPCHRRIDIKIYPYCHLAFAVNYFGSSKNFCKALRYWCNTPPPHVAALAAERHPAANAFKLTDTSLVPVHRARPHGGPSGLHEVVGEPVPAICETDIFRAVALEYVPPHMRDV